MKNIILALAASIGITAFAEYSSIGLTGNQTFDRDAAKIDCVRIQSTDADAQVSVFCVNRVRSYTNAVEISTETRTNVVITPSRVGVYSSEPFVYTNTTGSTFIRRGGSDTLSWSHITNNIYRFVYANGTSAYTNNVTGTNTAFVGGRAFDYTYISQTPSVSTNITTTTYTNLTPYVKCTTFITNRIADITCNGGFGLAFPTNKFIIGGENIITTGLFADGERTEAKIIISR